MKHTFVTLKLFQDFGVGAELKKKSGKKSENHLVAEHNFSGENMWLTPWQLLA